MKALLSYPCSGRTWLVAMIGAYITGPDDIPTWLSNTKFTLPNTEPFIISHVWENGFNRSVYSDLVPLGRATGESYLMLDRNPWDTMVSSFLHWKHRGRTGRGGLTYGGSLQEFIRDPWLGIEAWSLHNQHLRDNFVGSRDLWLTYRHLLRYPYSTFDAVIAWLLDEEPDIGRSAGAVEAAKVENMQKIKHPHLDPIDPANPETFKVRKARVSGYRDYLTPEDVAYIYDALTPQQRMAHEEVLRESSS